MPNDTKYYDYIMLIPNEEARNDKSTNMKNML